MNKFIKLDFVPFSSDLGLLVLRVWLGLTMFFVHGLEKLSTFGAKVEMFSSMGIPKPAAAAAILAEGVASLLLVIGLATRWASGALAVTMAVAFFVAHKASLDPQAPAPGSGELAFLYLAGFVALLIAGAGRYSADAKLK
jgi:putative oxidoreductase